MSDFDTFKDRMVVITGFSKSGTTLLQSLLDYHPELVVYPEEFKYFKRVFIQGYCSLEEGKEEVMKLPDQFTLGQSGGAAAERKRDYSDLDLKFFKKRLEELVGKAKTHKEVFLAYIEAFYETLRKSDRFPKGVKKAWVIKRPSDYYLFHRYKEWFNPDNVIWIHLRRDPYDNFGSIHLSKTINRSGKWTPRHFAPDWLLSELFSRKLKKEFKNFHIVNYEDLAGQPEETMRRIAGVIGIDFNESLLQPTLNGHQWDGNSAHGTVFVGVSNDSVGKASRRLADEVRLLAKKELRSFRNKVVAWWRYLRMMFHRHFPGKRNKFY
ncbi:MAG: sulfotransferase [Candidatus Pacebacteria bacterium]|jgi:hypothetical protein|nr:hypothetical protein [bacterium]MDP6527883.1 sulfotransferase [Candidatus Paceibacterota bacterium]MDP6659693.1 sulfotransferase [Candidatus Paceibacterota bacterium]|tara:strand:- start:35257 stop:36225 length:969 start_codon:yes stop_codon:yes gene_type:complete